MKTILIILILVVTACGPHTNKYIQTKRHGLVPYSGYYCELGMLLNNKRENIPDLQGKLIACTGYVNLTREQARDRGYTR